MSSCSAGCGAERGRFKRRLDVAAIARAMGLPAWKVDAPGQIQGVLRTALELRGPAVIEVLVDGTVPPLLGDRIRSIAGFIKGVSNEAGQ